MPSARTMAFAVPLRNQRSGLVTQVNARCAPTTALPTFSGSAIAQFFGTSSPKTIWVAVAMRNAAVNATASDVSSGRPAASIGTRSSAAMEGSAMKPTTRLVIVMPSWAPESCVDSVRRPAEREIARLSPSPASRATVGRSTVTRANSAATKIALKAIRTTTRRSRSHSVVMGWSTSSRCRRPPVECSRQGWASPVR